MELWHTADCRGELLLALGKNTINSAVPSWFLDVFTSLPLGAGDWIASHPTEFFVGFCLTEKAIISSLALKTKRAYAYPLSSVINIGLFQLAQFYDIRIKYSALKKALSERDTSHLSSIALGSQSKHLRLTYNVCTKIMDIYQKKTTFEATGK